MQTRIFLINGCHETGISASFVQVNQEVLLGIEWLWWVLSTVDWEKERSVWAVLKWAFLSVTCCPHFLKPWENLPFNVKSPTYKSKHVGQSVQNIDFPHDLQLKHFSNMCEIEKSWEKVDQVAWKWEPWMDWSYHLKINIISACLKLMTWTASNKVSRYNRSRHSAFHRFHNNVIFMGYGYLHGLITVWNTV